MSKSTSSSLWRPANALAALGVLLLRAVARLPMPVLQALGKAIGSTAAVLFPFRRHVGLVNLRLCYPDMAEKERRRLLYRHYQAIGMGAFELAAAWYKPAEQILAISTVTGLEHIEAVEASGRGALLITGHFTAMEMTGRILICHKRVSCLYRRLNQPVLAAEQDRIRTRFMRQLIHFDEAGEFVRCLRGGHLVWYTPDQGRRIKYSEVVPFFGEPAVTNTATARIARAGKAAIIPFVGYRKPDGTYQVDILPELQDMQTDDPRAEGIALNRQIEAFVAKAPEQYFWLHKRFKYRGPEHPDAYARRRD